MIPILGKIKVIEPNTVVKNDTFKPPASIPEEISPIDSIASKALIMPIIEPKNPITNPNKLASDAKAIIFLDFAVSFFKLKKPHIKKNMDTKRQIKIKDIKNGPPSLKRSTKGFKIKRLIKLSDNIFIINDFN